MLCVTHIFVCIYYIDLYTLFTAISELLRSRYGMVLILCLVHTIGYGIRVINIGY